MSEIKINDGSIQISLRWLLSELEDVPPDQLLGILDGLSWNPVIIAKTVDLLANEFSRENYNTCVHTARLDFLCRVKEQEIKYYANSIADKIEERFRKINDYNRLYHHVFEHYGHVNLSKFPERQKIDFEIRRELAAIVENAFKERMVEPGEGES